MVTEILFIIFILIVPIVLGIWGLCKIIKEYKKSKSLIEKEPDWVSWFYFPFITIWIILVLMGIFTFPASILGVVIGIWCGYFSFSIAKKYKGNPRVALIFGLYGLVSLLIYYLWKRFVDIEDKR